jgi:hypothetical protein
MIGFMGENAISSKEGKGFITRNGQNKHLFRAKSIEAKLTKNKQEIRMLGNRMVGHKTTSIQGAGSLVIYETSSEFKQDFIDYIQTGRDVYFNLQLETEDKSTSFGKESIVIPGCNFDEIIIASLSAEDGILEQELPFTFEGTPEILKAFKITDQGEI